jgi:diguanylate cyclase (GGDEF)-like protein/PAS domain S-box-containing protein
MKNGIIQSSETKYRRLFESAQDGILILNAKTAQIDDVNPYLIKLLGYSREEFLGKKLWEIGALADTILNKDEFRHLQESKFIRYDALPLVTKAGAHISVEFVSNAYECDGVEVIQCNIRDNTKRHLAEMALRITTRSLKILSEGNVALLGIIDETLLYQEFCKIAVEVGNYQMAWIGIADKNLAGQIRPIAQFGQGMDFLGSAEFRSDESPLGNGLTGRAIRLGKIQICEEIATDPTMAPWHAAAVLAGFRSGIALPIHLSDREPECLTLYGAAPIVLSEPERIMLLDFAANLAIGIGLIRITIENAKYQIGLQKSLESLKAEVAERKRIEAQLREEERFKQVILDSAPSNIAVLNSEGVIIAANAQWRLYGLENGGRPEGYVGQNYLEICQPKGRVPTIDGTVVHDGISSVLAGQLDIFTHEYPCHSPTEQKWFLMTAAPLQGPVPGAVISHSDITIRKLAEQQLELEAAVFEGAVEGIAISDAANLIVKVNPSFERITGYSAKEAIGQNPKMLSSGRQNKEFYRLMWEQLIETGLWTGEIWNKRKSGEIFPERLSISRITNKIGEPVHYIEIFSDITGELASQEKIHRLAYMDLLTGLPNRQLMLDRIQGEIDRCARVGGQFALLFIDLDLFKNVNDRYGHPMGDELLNLVGTRLRDTVRKCDIVGRLGGDEFLLIIPDLGHSDFVAVVAESIVARLAMPFLVKDIELLVSGSIGISVFPDDANNVTELMKHADVAMYEAKKRGRNGYQYFSAELHKHALWRSGLNSALREAIQRNELRIAWQPQVDLSIENIVGIEALLRWTRADGTIISPAEFIPIAEESGLIVTLGDWVIATVCRQIRAWRDQGFHPPPIAINISAIQIERAKVGAAIRSYLKLNGLEPSAIAIELTESVLMRFSGEVGDEFRDLINVGSQIAIDDFGTGYSSLAYLKYFAVAKLKIDIAFVREIVTNAQDSPIVRAITSMADQLGMMTIAEGVETMEQAQILKTLGVDIGQGYFWSRPIETHEIETWLLKTAK